MAKRERNWQPDIYDLTPGASTDLDAAQPVVVRVAAPARPRGPGDNEALLGLVAGAVVGAVLTLLIAPASGARLRAQLRGRVRSGVLAADSAQTLAQKMPNNPARGSDTPATGEQNQ